MGHGIILPMHLHRPTDLTEYVAWVKTKPPPEQSAPPPEGGESMRERYSRQFGFRNHARNAVIRRAFEMRQHLQEISQLPENAHVAQLRQKGRL